MRRAPSRGAAVGAGGAAGCGVVVSSPSSIDGGARPAAVWLAPHGHPPARSAGGGAARSTLMPARTLGRRRVGGTRPRVSRIADRRASRGVRGGRGGAKGSIRKYGRGGDAFVRLQLGSTRRQTYIMVYSKHQMNCNGSGIVLRIVMVRFKTSKVTMAQIQLTPNKMGRR